jgi:CAAX prenyl protease-like protein
VAPTGTSPSPTSESPPSLLEKHPWLIFLLPMAVYSIAGSIEPSRDGPGGKLLGLAIPYSAYPLLYTLKIALTLVAMALVLPGYRQFRRPPSWLAVLVGAVGVGVWVGLCCLSDGLGLTPLLDHWLNFQPRPGFNPLLQLAATPAWAWTFLAIRFFGLVVVVPVMEEFFLRGFLMRLVVDNDWWKVPFGKVNAAAVAVSIVVPVLTHQPGEYLAAAAWFGMVTWLMVRTRNPWDCVLAHAFTNLLLGVYVMTGPEWARALW